MAFLQKQNNAKSLVDDNPLLIGATTVNVTASEGANFPAVGDFMLTIWDKVSFPDPSDDPDMEIVRGTARTTDAITITRAQEGTAAVEHAQGLAIEMLITAGTLDEHFDQDVKTSDTPIFKNLTLGDGSASDIAITFNEDGTDGVISWDNTNDKFDIDPAIFVNVAGDRYSMIGVAPTILSPSDAIDNLVAVKSTDADNNIRGILAVGEYTGSSAKTTTGFGANIFFYHIGSGDSTHGAVGEVANRCSWFGRSNAGTVAMAGAVLGRAVIQGQATGMTLTNGYAFLAEGNGLSDANGSIFTNSYNFWGMDFGAKNAGSTLVNNMGFIQERLTDGATTNIEFGVTGEGIMAFNVVVGTQPTEYIRWTDDGEEGIDILEINSKEFIDFVIDGTKTTSFSVDSMGAVLTNTIDLGNTTVRWRDLFLEGDVDLHGDVLFTAVGSGLTFGEIYVTGNTVETTITSSGKANKVQVTVFNVNGESNNVTPDHTNDHVTIDVTGKYYISVCIHADSVAGGAAEIGWSIWKNNGATEIVNLHSHRNFAGGGGEAGAANICGLVSLTAGDTIELWCWNESGTENIINTDMGISVVQVGG